MDKEDIVAVSAKLFETKGYHATTMREIADELGVTGAALYYHVSRKEDILCEIFDKAMTAAESRLEKLMSLDMPLDARVERIIHEHINAVLDEAPLMAVFFNEVENLPPDAYRVISERITKYRNRVTQVFKEAMAQSLLEDLDPELVVLGILGMCNWMYRWYRPQGRYGLEEIAQVFSHMVLEGIRQR